MSESFLEEDQRKLPCHQKGSEFKPWETKFFKPLPPPEHIKIQNAYVFKYKDNERLMNPVSLPFSLFSKSL